MERPLSDTASRPVEREPTRVNIGSSMLIQGELTGKEDLTIDGQVEGKIFLNGHRLTVARNGKIRAEISDASSVVVHGEMIGDITATDRVEVASSGSMRGDIRAPRVVLAEGARFKGCIDMDPGAAKVRPPGNQSNGRSTK